MTPSPRHPTSTARTALAGLTGLAVVGAVLATAPAAGAAPGSAATTACPRTSAAGTAVRSTLSGGTAKLGSRATITGSSATACGLLQIRKDGKLALVVQPRNVHFAPVVTKVGLLSLPTALTATSVLTGPLAFTPKGQTATLKGSVLATADIQGQHCAIPLTVTLTTGASGPVHGTPFQFDQGGTSRGRLAAGTFAVPAIAPSPSCNLVVAGLSNVLLGLPLPAGSSSIVYDASLKIV